jgi:hypothetical protein
MWAKTVIVWPWLGRGMKRAKRTQSRPGGHGEGEKRLTASLQACGTNPIWPGGQGEGGAKRLTASLQTCKTNPISPWQTGRGRKTPYGVTTSVQNEPNLAREGQPGGILRPGSVSGLQPPAYRLQPACRERCERRKKKGRLCSLPNLSLVTCRLSPWPGGVGRVTSLPGRS